MKQLTSLEYLGLSPWHKFTYSFVAFWNLLPSRLWRFCCLIGRWFKKAGIAIKNNIVDIGTTWKYGDWKTRVSYVIMGFGNLARGQWLRGIVFLLFEIVFIGYTAIWGWQWLAKLNLQDLAQSYDEEYACSVPGADGVCKRTIPADNSLQILVYSVLTIFFLICLVVTWRMNVKQNRLAQECLASEKHLATAKQDGMAIIDKDFHWTVMALPIIGILIFTVMPIIVMIMVAFTNFMGTTAPPLNTFTWNVDAWSSLFTWESGGGTSFSATFVELLVWTLVWAVFATFSNYFLGMFVAMMINRKGIKGKKVWRAILVLTIAIPQFISLLYISHLFDDVGLLNRAMGTSIPFWTNRWLARVMVIVLNIWVGIPYLMLITTGVLMNIPADLYESAKIDGANAWQMYARITLPYMFFVTGPYLLTSFVSNMNNFNVIYLLTGGAPLDLYGGAGRTDLLVTWIYKLCTSDDSNYAMASIVGLLVFLVVAIISLIVYNVIPSTKNEEDFA